jgi:hypothetical protein
MSGETEEEIIAIDNGDSDADGNGNDNSFDSALIWSDNPELEYFRSMMENRMDNKLASGCLDVEDSLIGDSTVREMLELVYDGGGDPQSNSRRRRNRNDGSPLRPWVGVDTSGLSDAGMSNTVDNIYIEDISVFNTKQKKTTLNNGSHFDDGTIESHENEDLLQLPPKPTRTQHRQSSQEQHGNNATPNTQHQLQQQQLPYHHQSRQPRETLSPPHLQPQRITRATQLLNIPHGAVRDFAGNRETPPPKESSAAAANQNIPGFIFVTDGHPSIIHTGAELKAVKKPPSDSTSTEKNGKPERAASKAATRCFPRSLILCLTFFFIVASTVIAVLVYRINSASSSEFSSSSSSQTKNNPPTFEPSLSSLRATNRPQVINNGVPTSSPATDEPSRIDTDSELPTKVPPSPSPSLPPSPSPTISVVFPPLFEEEDVIEQLEPTPTFPVAVEVTTAAPTASTTSTTSNEACITMIATDKECYNRGDDIQISFNNCEPTATDWIGIYPLRQGVQNLRQPRTWVWTCGDQLCNNNAVVSGNATINDFYDTSGIIMYRALLLRGEGNRFGGYAAYAIGNSFRISSDCNEQD